MKYQIIIIVNLAYTAAASVIGNIRMRLRIFTKRPHFGEAEENLFDVVACQVKNYILLIAEFL